MFNCSLQCISQTCEYEWGAAKPKEESCINMQLIVPDNTEEMLIVWMDLYYSTLMQEREGISAFMPSLTLWPCENERSMMNLHFPGLDFFGITPMRLTCSLVS